MDQGRWHYSSKTKPNITTNLIVKKSNFLNKYHDVFLIIVSQIKD